jgi:pimeloyl-ACP methyl ester carboxylesterase
MASSTFLVAAVTLALVACNSDEADRSSPKPNSAITRMVGMGAVLPEVLAAAEEIGDDAGRIPELLVPRVRVCTYDRANVGRSDGVDGGHTARDSVEDLHRLLRTAQIPGPYVLLGASFGGVIAQLYAASHPSDVAGMVLLDSPTPADLEIERSFVPKAHRFGPDDWKRSAEQLDDFSSLRQLHEAESRRADVPLTYIATRRIELDPSWPVEEMTAAVRRAQRALVRRHAPGRLLVLDVHHYMEPEIPERIARETERVIGLTPVGGAGRG